ncbi:MAG: alpha/beta fold hydrolase [Bacteroidota bacterium]
MTETPLTLPARDGFLLSALLLAPATEAKGAVLLAGGTGIKKEFYLNYARHVCSHGYAVLLFDYRGIGGSRPSSLRGFEARNFHWGQRDMPAMLDWLAARYPDVPKVLIGHSAGGQQLGFMDNHALLSKALLISSSVGYWNALASPYKYFTLFLWHVVVPITSATVGYVPASWFGLGEDLPKGVARDWRHWCLQPDYYRSYLGTIVPHHYFDSVTLPLHFLFPEDDTIVTDRSVEGLTCFYTSAPITVEKLTLADFGLAKVGHLGYFSRRVKDSLWPKTISFLEG